MSSLFLWNGNVVARHVDAKLLHAAQQRGALYSQTNGRSMGPRDDAIGQFERAQDLGPLRLVGNLCLPCRYHCDRARSKRHVLYRMV